MGIRADARPPGRLGALLAAFVAIERRSAASVMPFSIFRIRAVTGANVAGLALGGAMFGMIFVLTPNIEQVTRAEDLAASGTALPAALTEGFQVALLAGAGFALGGALAAIALIRRPARGRRGAEGATRPDAAPQGR